MNEHREALIRRSNALDSVKSSPREQYAEEAEQDDPNERYYEPEQAVGNVEDRYELAVGAGTRNAPAGELPYRLRSHRRSDVPIEDLYQQPESSFDTNQPRFNGVNHWAKGFSPVRKTYRSDAGSPKEFSDRGSEIRHRPLTISSQKPHGAVYLSPHLRAGNREDMQAVVENDQDDSFAVEEYVRPPLDPDTKRKVLNVFNDVWYDFDDEEGMINKTQFKQVMGYCKTHIDWKEKSGHYDPFSEVALDRKFDEEYSRKYRGEPQIVGKIPHRAVLYMCAEVYHRQRQLAKSKWERLQELQKVRQQIADLKATQHLPTKVVVSPR
jgi:hypothetical protein